jgi:putative two-component system response regulator
MSPHDALDPDVELPITTLIVAPEDEDLASLQRPLEAMGHEVIGTTGAGGAMAQVLRRKISCVLLHVRLPDGSGLDLVPQILEQEPHAAIVLLAAEGDTTLAAAGMQRGARDYLLTPVDPAALERTVSRALAHRRERINQAETQAWLKNEIIERGRELRIERGKFERISVATLEALVNALEAKDPYLRGHSTRIAELSAQIAAELGLPEERVALVRTAGRLHDIGKIGIRESVIDKHGSLTEEEFEHVKTHVVIGAQILAPLTHLREVIAFVRSHHERIDGSGYPDGLAGTAIPIGGRIIGAAEVYDALTTLRPYQDRMEEIEAAGRMRDLVGTVLDGQVVEALMTVVAREDPPPA